MSGWSGIAEAAEGAACDADALDIARDEAGREGAAARLEHSVCEREAKE